MIVRIFLVGCVFLIFYIPVSFAAWRTYTNKEYGFTISYPPFLRTSNQFSTAYLLGRGWSINDYNKNNAYQHSLFEIQLQNNRSTVKGVEYYYRAYVRIGISTLPSDIVNCQKARRGFKPAMPRSRIIGGKKVYLFDFSNAAMSQYNLGTIYRFLNEGKCYSIEYIETGSNRDIIPHYKAINKKDQILAKKIISSFKLINGEENNAYRSRPTSS